MHIALGCALENLLIAAEHFGYGHQITHFPQSDQEDLVAIIKFTSQGKPSFFRDSKLFDAIPKRHTNRKTYQKRAIPRDDLVQILNCCVEKGVDLHIIGDLTTKKEINRLLIQGHKLLLSDRSFRKESAEWLGKGLFNMHQSLVKLIQIILPRLNVGRVAAIMDKRLVMSAPNLAVLSSSVDNRVSQVKIGQCFERICLIATMLGISVHPLSGIMDAPEIKAQVVKLLPDYSLNPTHIFRLGYANPVTTPAKRRPLSEVLIEKSYNTENLP